MKIFNNHNCTVSVRFLFYRHYSTKKAKKGETAVLPADSSLFSWEKVLSAQIFVNLYSKIALILRTPAEEDCSLTILKCPSSPVCLACGPPHISRENVPIE